MFEPVWRLPCVLDKYRGGGRRSKLIGPVPGWMEAGIESGLIQMMQHEQGEPPCCGWMEQIDKSVELPKISEEDLELMMAAGLINIPKDKQ